MGAGRVPENFKMKLGIRTKNYKPRTRKIFKPGTRVSGPGRQTRKKPGPAPIPALNPFEQGAPEDGSLWSDNQIIEKLILGSYKVQEIW